MPDIPTTSAVSAASAPTAVSGANIVVETAVNSVPDKIGTLSRQIEVSGTLANAPAGNSVTLNTVIGPLILMLPTLAQAQQDKLLQQLVSLFQNQKPLTVVMQPGNPPSQAFLLLPPTTQAAQYQSGTVNVQTSSAPAQPLGPPISPNTLFTGVVLPKGIALPSITGGQTQASGPNAFPNPITYAPPNPAVLANIPPPGQQQAVLAAEMLAKLAEPDPSVLLPDKAVASPNAPPVPQPQISPSIANVLQSGAEVNIRINSVIPPGQGANIQPPNLQNNQIVATVTGSTPGGQILIKAGDATLFVREPVDAPVGTQLVITVEPSKPSAAAYVTAADDPQFAALQQIISSLSQADPALMRGVLGNRMPQPGEGLTGAMLFFLSAVRQGDVRSWLGGGATDALMRMGKNDLILKLAQELQQSGQTGKDGVVGEWKSYPIPLYDQHHLNTLYFHIHSDGRHQHRSKEEQDSGAAPNQVRFVVDVRMSRLGAMQLDGFLRAKQLDIIIRSENPLPPWLNEDLRQSYIKTMAAVGYSGGLNFQFGRQGWLNIQRPAAGAAITT